MRTFILALVVFFLIVGILIFTGKYLIGKTTALTDAAKSLPIITGDSPSQQNIAAALENFNQIWKSTRKAVHFLVGHEEADKIDDTLSELQIRWLTHDAPGYMAAREKLLQSITRLADSESFSFDTVT